MTSSNGNTFRVTGPLCGELTGRRSPVAGRRWIPRSKASHAELWCSVIFDWINSWVNNRGAGDLRRHRAHYDTIVMTYFKTMSTISTWETVSQLFQRKEAPSLWKRRGLLWIQFSYNKDASFLNSSPPGKNGRHFADDVCWWIFMNGKFCI